MPGPDPATLTFSTRHIPPPSRHRALRELSEQGLLPVVPLADRAARRPGQVAAARRLDTVRAVRRGAAAR
jgi:hypothetical protein